MSETIAGLIILGYIAIGLFVSSVMLGESTEGMILIIFFWPFVLIIALIFGIVVLIHTAGLKIHELIFK